MIGFSSSPGAPLVGESISLTPEQQAKQKVEARQRARTDKMFLAALLGYDFQPDVHTDLFAQYIPFDNSKPLMFEQSKVRDRLTLWPRGHYKTSSIVVEIVQLVLNFPDVRVMLMSGTLKKSKALLKEVRSHFDRSNPKSHLDTLFPEFCAEKIGAAEGFIVPARERRHLKEPTVGVASPKASKAGYHYDVGFFDDLVDEINYKNPELLKQTIQDFVHYIPLIDPGGYRYVTGTRYTFGDLYEWIIRNNDGRWQVSLREAWTVKPDGSKTVLFPQRQIADGRHIGFTVEMLEAIQRDNPETFSAQYLNRPIAEGQQEFTQELLMRAVRPKDTQGAPVGPAILFVDLAEGQHQKADNRVVVCGRTVGGIPTVCDIRSGQWPTLDIATNIIEMAISHRPLRVMIEGSPGSTYFIDYLKMIAKDRGVILNVDKLKTTNNKGAKHLRISAVAGAIKSGRLKFLTDCCPGKPKGPTWTDLVQQFVEFPKGLHDDEIDTIALMVQFYSGHISLEPLNDSNLPFFLRQPGVDFSFESRMSSQTDDLVYAPEPIF